MKHLLAVLVLLALPMSQALAQYSDSSDSEKKQETEKKSKKKSKKSDASEATAEVEKKSEKKSKKADKAAKKGEESTEAETTEVAGDMMLAGYLIDKHCADAHPADLAKSAGHDTACVKKCAGTGSPLGIVADGKFYAFDAASQEKAAAALKGSKSKKGVRVEVKGALAGDEFAIASIAEASPAN